MTSEMDQQKKAAFAAAGIVLLSAIALGASVQAQEWPARPITMVVPFAAGGPVDLLGRILAQHLSEVLPQRVLVENVTGAGGISGTQRVARARPDGYQFVLGGVGTMAFTQSLYKELPYDSMKEFAPVILTTEQPLVLIARNDFPANDLQGFIAYARHHAAAMSFGSGGVGSADHLGCALLNASLGVEITHIPYRGSAPAMPDLMAGRIDYMCDTISTAFPHIQAHEVKAIALLGKVRSTLLPDLATADQQGLSGFDLNVWNALFFPAGAPEPIVRRLHDATATALDTPSVREKLNSLGISVVPPERRSAAYLAVHLKNEIAKWGAVIKAAGIEAQ